MSADRNLLFAVLALQADCVTREQFIDACTAWAANKSTPIDALMVQKGWLTPEDRADVERLVERKLKKHGGDVRKSLAEAAGEDVRQSLALVPDSDLRQSLAAGLPADFVGLATLPPPASSGPGRYSLSRVHAMGGIGRVWLAHDTAMGRSVALKELRPERAGEPATIERFVKEARITGQLEHPGIVPIYELAHRPQDNEPFYTMRFIRGRTLAAAIRRFHEPKLPPPQSPVLAFRELLTAFLGACNATAYAHSRGVIHRDLKPANIVLGDYGEVMVLDWGMAKVLPAGKNADPAGPPQDQISAPEAGLTTAPEPPPRIEPPGVDGGQTVAGLLMGTPAYMPPEQAEGRHDLHDQRSDVYALGAILYEILTGVIPFEAPNTEALLEKICREPPPRPRAQKQGVPPPLEAVCLKALAKRREDRYPSTLALADDVQHWLADEPVGAYAEPWSVLVGRWMRNHRTLVGSTAAALLLALVSLAIVAFLIQVQKHELARKNLALEQANVREKSAAELAQKTIEDMTSNDTLKFLETEKELRKEQRTFLERALEYYRQYAARKPLDFDDRSRHADAYFSMGYLQERLGLHEAAMDSYAASIVERERFVAEHPDIPDSRRALAHARNNLGHVLARLGKYDDAEREDRAALKEWEWLVDKHPEVPDFRRHLARSYGSLAILLDALGKLNEAEQENRAALIEQERLVKAHPEVPDFRKDIAHTRNGLGNLLMRLGKQKDAEREHREALKDEERLVKEHPQVPDYRLQLARTHNNLGVLFKSLGNQVGAEQEYRAGLKEWERLSEEHPQVPDYRNGLASAHGNLGNLLAKLNKQDAAELEFRAAIKEEERLVNEYPNVLDYREGLGNTHSNLATLLAILDKRDEAEREFGAAIKAKEALANEHPEVPTYSQELARTHNNLGHVMAEWGKLDKAEGEFRAALKVRERLLREHPEVPELRSDLASSHYGLGVLLVRRGKREEAVGAYRAAIKEGQRLVGKHPQVPQYRLDLARTHYSLALALEDQGKGEGAEQEYRAAIKEQQPLVKEHPQVREHHEALASSRYNLGIQLAKLGKGEDAEREFRAAIKEKEWGDPWPRVSSYLRRSKT